ncbi:F0F1 ATP synthase subunit A [Streptococcus sp. DD13]|uniref:F0F1 ATP synthase subunit A n=1 Tax=Streptococcus sp. DD13 TaxID=1777881 RepID=UPI00079790B5|nr:F0F1 ATP synthase subunit A [Streptococcus sp. DD13]KXT79191.1 ATP synthase A chain [Streptococcus sp. DD13]
METLENPTVQLFGIEFDLTILAMSLLTVLLVFAFVFWASRRMTLRPKGKQNVLEYIYDFVQGVIQPNLGQYSKNYSLFAFVLFLFLMVANNIGLVTKLESKQFNFWTSPTSVTAVDFGLALMVSLICQVEGIRKQGLSGYFKGFLTPIPAMLPMNILEEITNLASLTLRLYGNIYAGEVVLSLLLALVHWNVWMAPLAFILNILWTGFSIFISAIQAYVFIMLTSTYIGHKVNHEE